MSMKLLKKSQPQSAEVSEVSLEERIRSTMEEAGAVIEAEAQGRKASPDAAMLPIDWLRMNTRAPSGGGSCNCKCALKLLEKKK
jgi:hypothetical protein